MVDLFMNFEWTDIPVVQFCTCLGLPEIFDGQPYSTISWLVTRVFSMTVISICLVALGYAFKSSMGAFPNLFPPAEPVIQ